MVKLIIYSRYMFAGLLEIFQHNNLKEYIS
jgi:hypothetical protein